jgi:hypothetical protein
MSSYDSYVCVYACMYVMTYDYVRMRKVAMFEFAITYVAISMAMLK